MNIITNELSGVALNYAVALALGHQLFHDAMLGGETKKGWWLSFADMPNEWIKLFDFLPVTDANLGMKIIEDERITLSYDNMGDHYINRAYYLDTLFDDEEGWSQCGRTHLEAGLRTFVCKKLGCSVEIPDSISNL